MSLCFFNTLKLDLGEFAYTVNQFSDAFSEFFSDFFFGCRRIFDDIMENGGHQCLMIHMHFTQNTRNFQWMINVWFTADTLLSFVCLGTELIGLKYPIYLLWFQIRTNHVREIINPKHKATEVLLLWRIMSGVNLRQTPCRVYSIYWKMKMVWKKKQGETKQKTTLPYHRVAWVTPQQLFLRLHPPLRIHQENHFYRWYQYFLL